MKQLKKHIRAYIRQNRAATVIEFAIVLPFYLLLIFGIMELGYVFWGYTSLGYGASFGARYAFSHPTASSSTIRAQALAYAGFPGTLDYSVTITPNVVADISGTFTYNFLVLPLSSETITTSVHQLLP